MGETNSPPYATLELDEDEAIWLTKLLSSALKQADANFRDVVGMSGSDPRAKYRSMLVMSANIDQAVAENLGKKLSDQGSKTREEWKKLGIVND